MMGERGRNGGERTERVVRRFGAAEAGENRRQWRCWAERERESRRGGSEFGGGEGRVVISQAELIK